MSQSNYTMEAVIAERNRRIAIIQPLVDKGMKPTQISNHIGLNPEIIRHLIRNYCKRPEGYVSPAITGATLMDWSSELDPSNLTKEQREQAAKYGITEGRFAWLLSCPRTNSPYSHGKHG